MPADSPIPGISEGVPLVDGVEVLSADLVKELLKTRKCKLVDVRGADRASGMIEGALHVPAISMSSPFVSRLPDLLNDWKSERLVIFFCQFCKHRAPYCANLYRQQNDNMQRVGVLEGGFRSWQAQGLPVQDGGGTTSERATADAWALHQGSLIRTKHLGGPGSPIRSISASPVKRESSIKTIDMGLVKSPANAKGYTKLR